MYDQKKINIEKTLGRIEVLILGNSQAVSGLNPENFKQKAFNFAHDSQSLDYDMLITEKYLPELTNLKVVIIPISYFSLYYQLQRSNGSPRQYNYFFSYNLPIRDNKPLNIRKMSYIAAYSPRIAFGIVYLNKFRSFPQRDDGFAPREGTLANVNVKSMAAGLMSRHNELIKKGDFMLNVRKLDHFLGKLNRQGVKVVFTSIPVSEAYRSLQADEILRKNRETIAKLQEKHGALYVDLNDSSFTDEYFFDIDHLNSKGAAIVSARLDSVIRINSLITKN